MYPPSAQNGYVPLSSHTYTFTPAPGGYGPDGYPQNASGYPPGAGRLPADAAARVITGKVSSADGTPAIVSGNLVYFAPAIIPHISTIDGFEAGAEVTIEGLAGSNGGYMEPSRLTIDGKIYVFLKAAYQNPGNGGYGYGAPSNGYAAPPPAVYFVPSNGY
jgi:hypothetical protein